MKDPFAGFRRNLLAWYQRHKRALPWRKTRDPYKIWVSEVMLQQTTVAAVIPYYERWLKAFPNLRHLAKAPLKKVLTLWQGLGYYQRAKNLHQAAGVIFRHNAGRLPATQALLQKLPGFGPYTTGAVLSIAFDQRLPIIDANVRRVVMRILALRGAAHTDKDRAIHAFLDKVLPREGCGTFNQALMELGALVCRKTPQCQLCPVRAFCRAYQQGLQEIIPVPQKRLTKKIRAVAAVIDKKGCYFVQKRPSQGLLADLWEFPGGKVKKNETFEAALRRELQEELNVGLLSARPLASLTHFYTQFQVALHVFFCKVKPEPPQDKTHRWLKLKNFDSYPMPSGSVKIFDLLKKNYKKT